MNASSYDPSDNFAGPDQDVTRAARPSMGRAASKGRASGGSVLSDYDSEVRPIVNSRTSIGRSDQDAALWGAAGSSRQQAVSPRPGPSREAPPLPGLAAARASLKDEIAMLKAMALAKTPVRTGGAPRPRNKTVGTTSFPEGGPVFARPSAAALSLGVPLRAVHQQSRQKSFASDMESNPDIPSMALQPVMPVDADDAPVSVERMKEMALMGGRPARTQIRSKSATNDEYPKLQLNSTSSFRSSFGANDQVQTISEADPYVGVSAGAAIMEMAIRVGVPKRGGMKTKSHQITRVPFHFDDPPSDGTPPKRPSSLLPLQGSPLPGTSSMTSRVHNVAPLSQRKSEKQKGPSDLAPVKSVASTSEAAIDPCGVDAVNRKFLAKQTDMVLGRSEAPPEPIGAKLHAEAMKKAEEKKRAAILLRDQDSLLFGPRLVKDIHEYRPESDFKGRYSAATTQDLYKVWVEHDFVRCDAINVISGKTVGGSIFCNDRVFLFISDDSPSQILNNQNIMHVSIVRPEHKIRLPSKDTSRTAPATAASLFLDGAAESLGVAVESQ